MQNDFATEALNEVVKVYCKKEIIHRFAVLPNSTFKDLLPSLSHEENEVQPRTKPTHHQRVTKG